MNYLTFHHQSYYFQLRVPLALQPQYGSVVRENLQTTDPAVAKAIALRLASEWFGTFKLRVPALARTSNRLP
ncbi:DUF6538 domain-containing protein [Parazoarcus communis]|uniref:DUF6538 domain-containing protein n=1 Tax=Parazoarcus communis TaxID=41977 RepID=UPI00131F13C7|nr:DUF6538 domain-containing protein [Parazoarcus communis]